MNIRNHFFHSKSQVFKIFPIGICYTVDKPKYYNLTFSVSAVVKTNSRVPIETQRYTRNQNEVLCQNIRKLQL